MDRKFDSGLFLVRVVSNGADVSYCCRTVIIASGSQAEKAISPLASGISTDIKQLHSSEYRNPAQLPAGAVLVVGSGRSGGQIAEALVNAGRKVYLSTSKVPRCPRH